MTLMCDYLLIQYDYNVAHLTLWIQAYWSYWYSSVDFLSFAQLSFPMLFSCAQFLFKSKIDHSKIASVRLEVVSSYTFYANLTGNFGKSNLILGQPIAHCWAFNEFSNTRQDFHGNRPCNRMMIWASKFVALW